MLVRNLYMSVDPYMRSRMNDAKSYVTPFELGKPLEGGAVGEVIEFRARKFKPGDAVKRQLKDKLIEHKQYIGQNGEDLPEIHSWKWGRAKAGTLTGKRPACRG
jgi:NADPH-dependent curcumin reductase CurA